MVWYPLLITVPCEELLGELIVVFACTGVEHNKATEIALQSLAQFL